MKLKRTINSSSLLLYAYLALPSLIFILGWLKWYYALIGGVIISAFMKIVLNTSVETIVKFASFKS